MKIIDPALAEYLAQHGVVWRAWVMRDLNDEEFHYSNTPELKAALEERFSEQARFVSPGDEIQQPGRAVLGDVMKSFTQSAAQTH